MSTRQRLVYNLLKGIETGDPESVKVVNENKYIQHNPQTKEGGEGLAALFTRLAKTNPKVEIVRIFEDGDYVFAHTIYDFSSVRIGFEVFRYEGEQVVEHWDNIQPREGEMVAGVKELSDVEQTEDNRTLAQDFVSQVMIENQHGLLQEYVDDKDFIEHSTFMDLRKKCTELDYKKNHRILCQGDFALSVCEGFHGDKHISFYDLLRFKNGKIVEHWDTTETVPAKELWQNDNGKF
jgi:predicted SnoaL-like aldol condensation-catalyzing enzyme